MTDPKWWDMVFPREKSEKTTEPWILEDLTERLDRLCERYVIGTEIGDGGYKHFQVRAVFKVGKERATVKNQMGAHTGHEMWCAPSHVRDFEYCKKEGNFFCSWEKALRKYALIELRDWQAQALEFWNNETERQVYVIYDPVGNHGKTYFAKFMQATHRAQYVPPMGDAQDIMAFALEKPSAGYVVDLPRSESVKQKKGMWSAIEQLKNGYIYDKRYKYRDAWRDPARLIVFCNELPETDSLSADRWIIHQITETGLGSLLMPVEVSE